MKTVLSLAAVAALFFAFHNARAVEDPPAAHLQLVEVEQQTPYLESFAGVTAGTATTSIIRRVSQAGTSSQAYAQFDNHNGDGSRASFPLEVDESDTYGLSAALVKGPNFGVVQLFIDGRQIGETYDLYNATVIVPPPVALGPLALSEGKHILTMKVVGKNDASTDFLGGIDLLVLDSQAAPQPTPTAVATAEVGAPVPATLALTVGAGGVRRLHARRGQGVHDDLGGQHRVDGRRRRPDGLRPRQAGQRHAHAASAAAGADRAEPLERPGVQRPVDDHLQAGDRGRRAAAHRHLLQDADVHAVDDEPLGESQPSQADLDARRARRGRQREEVAHAAEAPAVRALDGVGETQRAVAGRDGRVTARTGERPDGHQAGMTGPDLLMPDPVALEGHRLRV